jgi:hypothetical protein
MMTSAVLTGSPQGQDYHSLQQIRRKFQLVFGTECTMSDDVLRRRYRVSPEGDLILIIS